jgi:hypothetical protein
MSYLCEDSTVQVIWGFNDLPFKLKTPATEIKVDTCFKNVPLIDRRDETSGYGGHTWKINKALNWHFPGQ